MTVKAKITVLKESTDAIINELIRLRAGEDAATFLNPPHPKEIFFENLFKNKKKALSSLKKLHNVLEKCRIQNETIIIYGDYDADGVTATAIMWECLDALGFSAFPFIPDRRIQGYGLSREGIDVVVEKYHPSLIITVDNGITANAAVKYAKKKGITVVISDHHTPGTTMPPADIIFHSTLVSGAGLAYFIARETITHFISHLQEKSKELLNDHMLLSAIGSIADLAQVVGITRSLIVHGLKRALTTKRYGIRLLIGDKTLINTFDVGYSIAPRINVFGRIDEPMDALRLLCTKDLTRAHALYQKTHTLTKTRKALVDIAISDKKQIVVNEAIVATVSEDLNEGVIGLVAADCVKKFAKPAFVICQSNGFYKGSMRSIGGVNAAKLLKNLQKYTLCSCFHSMSGVFTIEKKNFNTFLKQANVIVAEMSRNKTVTCEVDVALPVALTSIELVRKLVKLEPFGPGNDIPLFSSMVTIQKIVSMGKTKAHARLKVDKNSNDFDFVYFNGYDKVRDFSDKSVYIIYQLEMDLWTGREKVLRKVVTTIPI